MKRMMLSLLVVMSLGLLIVFAGCGSSNTLTKAELIEKGDKICETYKEKTDKIQPPKNFQDLEKSTEQVKQNAQEAFDDFSDLNPPKDDEGTIDEFLSIKEELIGQMDEVIKAAADQDAAKVQKIVQEGTEKGDKSKEIASEYGFKVCGTEDG